MCFSLSKRLGQFSVSLECSVVCYFPSGLHYDGLFRLGLHLLVPKKRVQKILDLFTKMQVEKKKGKCLQRIAATTLHTNSRVVARDHVLAASNVDPLGNLVVHVPDIRSDC